MSCWIRVPVGRPRSAAGLLPHTLVGLLVSGRTLLLPLPLPVLLALVAALPVPST